MDIIEDAVKAGSVMDSPYEAPFGEIGVGKGQFEQ